MRIKIIARDRKEYLYHATYGKYWDDIKINGLKRNMKKNWSFSGNKVIYLTNDPDIAESFAEMAEEIDEELLNDIIVLKIDMSALDKSKLKLDENITQEGEEFLEEYSEPYSFQYYGDIPANLIRIHKRIKANDTKIKAYVNIKE